MAERGLYLLPGDEVRSSKQQLLSAEKDSMEVLRRLGNLNSRAVSFLANAKIIDVSEGENSVNLVYLVAKTHKIPQPSRSTPYILYLIFLDIWGPSLIES